MARHSDTLSHWDIIGEESPPVKPIFQFFRVSGTKHDFAIGEMCFLVYDDVMLHRCYSILNDESEVHMTQTKCPVCFTKMNAVGHDLVCPECGYKYCAKQEAYTYDGHDHNQYRSYNQKTSYSGNYTTTTASTNRVATPQTNYQNTSATAPRANTGNAPKSAKQVKRVIITIILIYMTLVVLSALMTIFFYLV